MKLVTVAEMRAIEQQTDARGWSYAQMMEAAGKGLAQVVAQEYASLGEHTVLGLVGKGNNGGDTLVALNELLRLGWQATAYLSAPREDDPLVSRFTRGGGVVLRASDDPHLETLRRAVGDHAVLLDGLLGTGVRLPLREETARLLRAVKEAIAFQRPIVVAVDVPSGIDCDTGAAAEEALSADLTVTMAAAKVGMTQMPALGLMGEVIGVDIGIPEDLPAWQAVHRYWVDGRMVAQVLPPRPKDAYKSTFGTAMVVAGSVNYTGTALLAGEAAYRVGVGRVMLAVPALLHGVLAGHLPEATWLLLPHELGVVAAEASEVLTQALNERIKAMLIGPGLGVEQTTEHFLARLLGVQPRGKSALGFVPATAPTQAKRPALPPLVLDADGLKLLARLEGWAQALPPKSILTPHPAEMALLTGLRREAIQENRLAVAERFAGEWGHVVVLTGAGTVVAAPDGRLAVIPAATAALARAGTGGALAGVITGLLAQGVPPWEAAYAGAWLHAQAGMFAWEEGGSSAAVLARDVVHALPRVLQALNYT